MSIFSDLLYPDNPKRRTAKTSQEYLTLVG
jgi:hypothetical protein